MQEPSGAIPWEPGRHCDPWDHVEAAMGLDAAGYHSEARAAYEWLARMQAPDGSWAAAYVAGEARDRTLDSNFISYCAVGVWHHFLWTGDRAFLIGAWPMVERAIDFVLALQMRSGAIMWARDPDYKPWPGALLTASSCAYLSLGCAITLAETLGHEMPEWELAMARLGRAVREPGSDFVRKDRYSMDWYYPVLGRALTGERARRRLDERWDDFVVEGRGVLCVLDRPWVTTGETCELALACVAAGWDERAEGLLAWIQHLRTDEGLYWTGANYPKGDLYPLERTSWNAGAVLLARAALMETPTRALFTGEALVPTELYSSESVTPEP